MINFELKEKKKNLFFVFIRNNLKIFLITTFVIVLYAVLAIPTPYLSRYLIDDVFIKQKFDSLLLIISIFGILILSQIIIGRLSAKFKASFFKKFLISTQLKIHDSYINNFGIPKVSPHKLQTIVSSDAELLCSNYLQIVEIFFSSGIYFLGYIIILLIINAKLFLITIFFVPVYILWTFFYTKRIQKYVGKSQFSKESITKNLLSLTTNYIPIKIFNYIKPKTDIFLNNVNENGTNTEKLINYQNIVNIVANLIIVLATFIPLFLGVFFINSGELTLGELIAFNSYSVQLFSPLTSIIGLISTIKITEVYENRIQTFLEELESYNRHYSLDYDDTEKLLSILNYKLYSKNDLLLDIPSLTFRKGDFIKISGENGSGKSLFLKSLSNLYSGFSGNIYIENLNVRSLYQENLKENIVFVDNSHQFPLETIGDELNNKIMNQQEILKILDIVSLREKINGPQAGLLMKNSVITKTFSNGELQRYRIARALSRNPKLLIVDEVFSNIDIFLSVNIMKMIKSQFPNMTVFFVEHKTTEEMEFDQEYVIINKHLIEVGKED
ncbi:ABC transporter ATP-binding protein/permease [Enterococcus sp. BWT-B8]|uniref:ABC transporter transmembrane domain-containing protein n=1 Tax=Enterococcus sp. BWT-B8 TaxID=2885157 RepID=UPI001E597A0E|nr:ABC transporter ATP-binding protein [Enterococcus sp. BWT-B8]MCB5953039.1 ABC transporter ATP-binding protein/permease [Enterococcus sp. BWT-B8]